MTDCLFCRIAAGEIPSRPAHSDERVYAFHDIAPKAPTHVLVIPRKHIGKLADVTPEARPSSARSSPALRRSRGT